MMLLLQGRSFCRFACMRTCVSPPPHALTYLHAAHTLTHVHTNKHEQDNFYDQDGRLTKALWDQLSLDFKSTFLLTV